MITIDTKRAEKSLTLSLMSTITDKREVKRFITQQISAVRKAVVQSFRSRVKNDPRKMYRAIQMSVYKKVLGGNVNILRPTRGEGKNAVQIKKGGRSGKTRNRAMNPNTARINSYWGRDRYFAIKMLQRGRGRRIAQKNIGFFDISGEKMQLAGRNITEYIQEQVRQATK